MRSVISTGYNRRINELKRLTNKGQRRLGVPGRPAIILRPNESAILNEQQVADIHKNRTVTRWIKSGILELSDTDETVEPKKVRSKIAPRSRPRIKGVTMRDKREELVLPKGITGKGVEINHVGGGWWEIYVHGFKVTDRNVRKDERDEIAKEYEE